MQCNALILGATRFPRVPCMQWVSLAHHTKNAKCPQQRNPLKRSEKSGRCGGASAVRRGAKIMAVVPPSLRFPSTPFFLRFQQRHPPSLSLPLPSPFPPSHNEPPKLRKFESNPEFPVSDPRLGSAPSCGFSSSHHLELMCGQIANWRGRLWFLQLSW